MQDEPPTQPAEMTDGEFVGWFVIALVGLIVAGLVVVFLGVSYLYPSQEPEARVIKRPSTQTCLRALARQGPSGSAYWIGPSFHGLPVKPACKWSRYQGVSAWVGYFYTSDDPHIDTNNELIVLVYTVRRGDPAMKRGYFHGVFSRMHMGDGQDVILIFQRVKPSAELIRETRAAIRPIPRNITYSA